ncbi:hypothetical protein H7I75_01345 [Mycobacterium stomatepiae]|nr:hypothetical protein [Mycobacterium stomatepiae]
MADVRARERRRRQDFCAQTAHQLTAANAVVVLEDLKNRNMTRTAKGTLQDPGRNLAAKSGLNRAILAKGWHSSRWRWPRRRYTGTAVVVVRTRRNAARSVAGGSEIP